MTYWTSLLDDLKKALSERILDAELDEYLEQALDGGDATEARGTPYAPEDHAPRQNRGTSRTKKMRVMREGAMVFMNGSSALAP